MSARARGVAVIVVITVIAFMALGLGACATANHEGDDESTTSGGATTGTTGATTSAGTTSAGTSTTSGTSSTGPSTSDASTSTGAASTTSTTGMEEGECEYVQVVDTPGPVLWVSDGASSLEVTPLAPGEGFYCVRVEFDLQTLDNLADLMALDPELCPEYLAIASVFGTTARGEDLATSFLRVMDRDGDLCVAGATRLEVGNYLNYTADAAGPWPLGQAWHVVLEAKPWVTRISFAQGDEVVGPVIEASLYPANVADTRDPIIRLGLPKIVAGKFFPWYGATYANLQVWADVAPPP